MSMKILGGMAARPAEGLRQSRLTRRGWGVVTSGVLSILAANSWAIGELNYLGCFLLALCICSAGYASSGHSRVRVERRFAPAILAAGAETTVSLTVSNLSILPTAESRWRDRLPDSVIGRAYGALPPMAGGRSSTPVVRHQYRLQGRRRGDHVIGPLSIATGDPFGLVERERTCGDTSTLTVLPTVIALPAPMAGATGIEGADRAARHRSGLGVDDLIARRYVAGDEIRHLHWKATARRGELMVRQAELLDDPKVTVLLDTDARSYGGGRANSGIGQERLGGFEWAVVEAASIVSALAGAGFGLSMLNLAGESALAGDRTSLSQSHGRLDPLDDILLDLARIRPAHRTESDAAEIAHLLSTGAARPVVAITGIVDTEAAASWIEIGYACVQPVLFLDDRTTGAVVEELERAGWTCLSSRSADDLIDDWQSMGQAVPHVGH